MRLERCAGFRVHLAEADGQKAEQHQKPADGVKTEQHHIVDKAGNRHACSSSIKVPMKSLGCRNRTGLPCAPVLGSAAPANLAPCAKSRSRAAMISSTSK